MTSIHSASCTSQPPVAYGCSLVGMAAAATSMLLGAVAVR